MDEERKERKGRKKEKGRRIRRGIWNEASRTKFREMLRDVEEENKGIEEIIGEMKERIRKMLENCEKQKKEERIKKSGWWDEECRGKKKVRNELRKWRRKGGNGKKYREKKRDIIS